MNEGYYRDYGGACCYFHPKEVVVGVCHLCLDERLLILAAKQGVKSKSSKLSSKYDYYSKKCKSYDNLYHNKPKSYVTLPKIFAIASFFSHRRRRRDSDDIFFDEVDTTSTSLEDESFISIKFGDNGVASWDKTSSRVSKVPLEECSLSWGGQTSVKDATINIKGSGSNNVNKSVVEHAKPRGASLRWRKRIGQLFQVIRWKKSSKANGGGGGNNKVVEGVKVVRNNKYGWIRTLKGRTKE
ncbi:hypothetical protein BVRB_1g020370 [Beta vulgaris subsp. vulgaris]|nr:hypothetical protein BVRB_1g020370 [Beta vulgaris subsp. vulgaris]